MVPSGSVEPAEFTLTAAPLTVAANTAVGGWLGTVTATEWVTEVLAPPLSVTVRVIVYVPDWV